MKRVIDRTASSTLDFEALISIGAAAVGGNVIVRTHDDEDATIFLTAVWSWAEHMGFKPVRDRTYRCAIGDAEGNRLGAVETAPHDYAPGQGELVRDIPSLPKAAA